jgi:anti-anti-sigma factor
MSNKLQIALPAETESLPTIRNFVEDSCSQAGLDESTSYDIKLAVDEACMNIIEHGYAGMDPGSILVSLQYGASKLVVHIADFGHPFEPSEPPEPDPEAMLAGTPGGIGLYFIYRSVDFVSYEAAEGGNTLTLVKDLDPAASEEDTTLAIVSTQHGPVTVVSIRHDLDAVTSAEATAYLGAEIEDGHTKLVLDISGVTYLSSAGLRVILGTMQDTRQQGGDVRLVGAKGDVRRVLDMSGVTGIIETFPTAEKAVASFNPVG